MVLFSSRELFSIHQVKTQSSVLPILEQLSIEINLFVYVNFQSIKVKMLVETTRI